MSQPILLYVNDQSAQLEIRKSTLEGRGYSVVTATDGATALAALEKGRIAAVVLEYKFEGLDAEAIAWRIKRKFPKEPIVLLSAYSDMPERILWLVDDYVMGSEPFDGLVQVIARVTGSSRARAAGVAA